MTASKEDKSILYLFRFANRIVSSVPVSNRIFILFTSINAANPKDLIYPGSAPLISSKIIVILTSCIKPPCKNLVLNYYFFYLIIIQARFGLNFNINKKCLG